MNFKVVFRFVYGFTNIDRYIKAVLLFIIITDNDDNYSYYLYFLLLILILFYRMYTKYNFIFECLKINFNADVVI